MALVVTCRALLAGVAPLAAMAPIAHADSLGPAPRRQVAPLPRASASDAVGVIDRLPTTTRYVIAGRGLESLITQFATTPIGLVASQQGVVPQVSAIVISVATRAGWSGAQAMDNLLGDQAALVVLHPDKPVGPAQWALLARIDKPTAALLQATLDPQPGDVIDGLPVLTFERGRYSMALGRPFIPAGGIERRWLVLCPREGSPAKLVIPALNDAAPSALGATPIARELASMTDGSLIAMFDWSPKAGSWSSCAALGATKAEGGFDLSWQIREPGMARAAGSTGVTGPSLHDDSILVGLSEARLPTNSLTPALRAISMLRAIEPEPTRDEAKQLAGDRTFVFRRSEGKLRLDAMVSRLSPADGPKGMDLAMLALVAGFENKPEQKLSLNVIAPRVTEVLPAQGTILRAVMGERLSLWWSPERGQASLVGAGNDNLPPWTPQGEAARREQTWFNAGRVRPRELIGAIPADMRERVGMIGLRGAMERLESLHWRMWFDGQGEGTFVRGAGQLRLAPAKP